MGLMDAFKSMRIKDPPAAGGGEDDRVAQLERLAQLRHSAALSDQEFEREKARILGQ
jgi:hypothetical protein